MKKLVWLTVHGEQKYEGMSADSSELRVRGTMEETRDGYLPVSYTHLTLPTNREV